MGDQQRWFKLWVSAPSDDALQALPPALRWAWAALGCYLKVHGRSGVATLQPTNHVLATQMGIPTADLKRVIEMFPNVSLSVSHEEGKSDYGEFTVTWKNWHYYQEDRTVAERVKRLRNKRRGEENKIRRDKKRAVEHGDLLAQLAAGALTEGSQNGPVFRIPESIQAALARAPRLGAVTRIATTTFWQAEVRANGSVDLPAEILKAEAWLTAHPERHYKNLSAFLHNWLGRADRPQE